MQSLEIPQGPRNPNGYTRDEILRSLRGIDGSRKIEFRYELLNFNNEKIMDLEDHVLSGRISQNFLAVIKRTATFEIRSRGDIDFLNDRIKPYAQLKMPPKRRSVNPQPLVQDMIWDNSFDGPSGEPVTVSNSVNHGDQLYTVADDVTYSEDWFAAGTASAKLGADDGSEGGSFSFVVTEEEGFTTWGARFWANIPADGNLQFSPQPFGGSSSYNITIDDTFNNFTFGTIDVSSISSDLVGQPIRLEIDVREEEVEYRVYWTNPFGNSPDYVDNEIVSPSEPIQFFQVSGGGFNQGPSYIDEIQVVPFGPKFKFTPENQNFVEWPLGVFMMSSPSRDSDYDQVITRSVEAYDLSKLFIDDKVEDRYVVQAGQKFIDVIDSLLGDIPKIVEPIDTVVPTTREWPIGTEKENIINDLTQSINYESLTFDEDGNAVIRPYILPDERTPEYVYADDEVSVMHPEVNQELDLFDIANKWILVVSNPDQDPISVSLTNNDPASVTSTVRRNRVITDFREEMQVSDYVSLMKKARRLAFEASREFEAIEFDTAVMPIHSFNDVYEIHFSPLAISEKYTEHTWEMPLESGARMSHRARRVVRLDPGNDETYIDDDLNVTGAVSAGNIRHGSISVDPVANRPTSVVVTFPELAGKGAIRSQLTLNTTVPSNAREITLMEETPTSARLWIWRSTSPTTFIFWMMMRDP